jgi:vitellogenic carboxypeptidase-like protein
MGRFYSCIGKYVPNLAVRIHEENIRCLNSSEEKINLVGVAIGDGYIDPVNQVHFGEALYNVGLLDRNGRKRFELQENIIQNLIAKEKFTQAFEVRCLSVIHL